MSVVWSFLIGNFISVSLQLSETKHSQAGTSSSPPVDYHGSEADNWQGRPSSWTVDWQFYHSSSEQSDWGNYLTWPHCTEFLSNVIRNYGIIPNYKKLQYDYIDSRRNWLKVKIKLLLNFDSKILPWLHHYFLLPSVTWRAERVKLMSNLVALKHTRMACNTYCTAHTPKMYIRSSSRVHWLD